MVSEGGLRAEETAGGRPPPSDEMALSKAPAARGPASLHEQYLVVAALARNRGNDEAAAIAEAAAHDATNQRPRQDLADLADALAHQATSADR